MGDLDHLHKEVAVFDAVEDAVAPLTNPVLLIGGEFHASGRAGLISKGYDPGEDTAAICFGQALDFLDGGGLDLNAIARHALSSPRSRFPREGLGSWARSSKAARSSASSASWNRTASRTSAERVVSVSVARSFNAW